MSSDRVREFVRSIDGWLSLAEAKLLFHLAKKVPADECIVELGSFQGRSAACLAEGARLGKLAKVYAVDPHTGSPEHRAIWKEVDTYGKFQDNLKRFGLEGFVEPVRCTSEEAAKRSYPPIGLLFIDAQHELAPVWQDYRLWIDKVDQGGILAFHDTIHSDYPGPGLVTAALLLSGPVRHPGLAGMITYFQKSEGSLTLQERLVNLAFLIVRTVRALPIYLFWLVKVPLKLLGKRNRLRYNSR